MYSFTRNTQWFYLMLKYLFPDDEKANITIDDIRLWSNLTTNKTLKFTKVSFSNTILGFTQSRLGPLGDIKGVVQKIAGICTNGKPINITAIDKTLLKCDCINGSNFNGIREYISYSFAFDNLSGQTSHEKHRIKLPKKINKSLLSHIFFWLEVDDHKAIDFIGITTSFTCQLIKIQ